MKKWWFAACLAAAFAPAVQASILPDTLTMAAAEALSLSSARPERLAAEAGVERARAESLAVRVAPPVEWSLLHSRAGEAFGGSDVRIWELEAAREFDVWGRRPRAAAAAGLDRRAAQLAGVSLDARLRLEARAGLRAAAFAERRLVRLEALAAGERQIARRVASRVAEGSMTPLEGRLSSLEKAGVEAWVSAAEAERTAARLELARTLGVTDAAWALRVPLAVGDGLDTLAASADPERLASSRADLSEARAEVDAATAREQWAALAGRPDLTLSLAASLESSRSDASVFQGDAGGLTGLRSEDRGVSLRLSAPLSGASAANAARSGAAAARVRAEAEYAALEREVMASVGASRAAFERASRTAVAWRGLSAQAELDLARVREAYADGRLPHADYLALRRQLVDAVREALDLEANHWQSLAALERACGVPLESMGEVR